MTVNRNTGELTVLPVVPTASVRVIRWSALGGRLCVGDEKGEVLVYKVDAAARSVTSTPVCQYQLTSPIVTAVLRVPAK